MKTVQNIAVVHYTDVCRSVKNRLVDLLKKRQFDVVLPLLSAMKETWPSDAVFTTAAVTDYASDDSSISTDEDFTSNLMSSLQNIFLGEQLFSVVCCIAGGPFHPLWLCIEYID